MATRPSEIKRLYEFGSFCLDPQKRLLTRNGEAVPLTPKAIETLIVLVENRNRVVSKEDLMKTLWPDSFVEESNLSQNIFVLRKALGDSTQEKRYIVTVPGRGYQFTESVREIGNREELILVESRSLTHVVVEKSSSNSGTIWAIAIAVVLLLLLAATGTWWLLHRPEAPLKFTQRRLTANPSDLPVLSAAISPDGKYLGYSDAQGIHLQLIQTGETQNVPWPSGTAPGQAFWEFDFWYPDSTRFVAELAVPGKPLSMWSGSLLHGPPQHMIDDFNSVYGVSADGSMIAFSRGSTSMADREIWLMGPNGESPHAILTAEDNVHGFSSVAWPPSGSRITFGYFLNDQDTGKGSIQSADLQGGNRKTILSDDKLQEFTWISPSKLVYSRNVENYSSDYQAYNLWELNVDSESGVPQGKPRQITDWSGFAVDSLHASSDGKHLSFIRSVHHGSVFVGELGTNGSRVLNPRRLTMDDHSNVPLAWSADSKEVIFASRRTQALEIYRQPLDGSSPPQLVTTTPNMDFYNARLAPDDALLVVQGRERKSQQFGLYRVLIKGGSPELLFPVEPETTDYRCTDKRANVCMYGRFTTDQKAYIIQAFDLTSGKGKELLRIPIEPGANYHWGIAPDGSLLGILRDDWGANEIRLFSLRGAATRTITVKGYPNLQSFDWGLDANSMIVATSGPGGSTLLRVGLDGSVQPIWQQPQPLRLWGIPSPDGHHITMFGTSADANVWVMDNF